MRIYMENKRLLDVCDVYQPTTITTKEFIKNGKYAVYGANGVMGRYNKYNHENEEVLMACRGTCGTINMSMPLSWINGNAMVITPNGRYEILKKYLYFFMIYANKDNIISGTAQPQITRRNMDNFKILICNIDAQKRIVTKIEELFSELDKAVDTLQNIKKQFLKYRRSVIDYYLKCDFGSKDSLTLTTIGEVCHCFDNKRKPVKKDERSIGTGKYPYYGANGMTGKIDDYLFDEELVLVCEDETFVGRVKPFSYIINGKSWVNNHAHVLKGKSNIIDNNYLNYLLSYYPFLPLVTGTTGRKKLTKSALMSAPIKICSIEKQHLIVQEIESRFSVCDNIEKTIDTALLQSEALRQTILKQAFEGELIK